MSDANTTPAETAPAEAVKTTEATVTPTSTPAPALPTKAETDVVIDRYMLAAMGVGLVPVPVLDLVGVGAVQFKMIQKLAKMHGVEASDARVRQVLISLLGGAVPAFGALPLFAFAQMIPVIGWTVGAGAASILGGASTYAVGHIMRRHFEAGGSMEDFKAEHTKEAFKELVEKGKSAAKSIRRRGKSAEAAAAPAAAPAETAAP